MSNWSRDLLGVKTYSEVFATASISAGSLTLNLQNAVNYEVSLNANITSLTVSNVPSGSTGFGLTFVGDGSRRTVTWPASFYWPNGEAPSITSGSNKRDILSFVTLNSGSTWYGFVSGQNL